MPTETGSATEHESLIEKIEGVEKKVVTIMEAVAIDAGKGLAFAAEYAPGVSSIVSLLCPAAAPEAALATTAIELIQNAVMEVEAKAALLPDGLTGKQKSADVVALAGQAVTSLLTQAKLPATSTYVQKLVNLVVAELDVKTTTIVVASPAKAA